MNLIADVFPQLTPLKNVVRSISISINIVFHRTLRQTIWEMGRNTVAI